MIHEWKVADITRTMYDSGIPIEIIAKSAKESVKTIICYKKNKYFPKKHLTKMKTNSNIHHRKFFINKIEKEEIK